MVEKRCHQSWLTSFMHAQSRLCKHLSFLLIYLFAQSLYSHIPNFITIGWKQDVISHDWHHACMHNHVCANIWVFYEYIYIYIYIFACACRKLDLSSSISYWTIIRGIFGGVDFLGIQFFFRRQETGDMRQERYTVVIKARLGLA